MRKSVLILSCVLIMCWQSHADTRAVSIEEAIETAATQSYEVQRAKVDVLLEKADRLKTYAQMGPTFGFNFSDTTNDKEVRRQIFGQEILIQPLNTQQSTISLGLNLTAVLAGLVKVWSQSASVGVSAKTRDLISSESAFRVAEYYRLAQQAKAAVEVARSRLVTAKKQQNDAVVLAAFGKISKADKLQIDFSLNNSELGLLSAENESLNALAMLQKILDIDAQNTIELAAMKEIKSTSIPDMPEKDESLQKALQLRDDISLANLNVDALQTSKWLNFASYLPLVQVDTNWRSAGENISTFSVQQSQYLTIKLSWQFWDNGAALIDFRKSQLQVRKANISLREKIVDAEIDVQRAWRNASLAKETLQARERGLEQAREAYRGAEARFALGSVSVTDILFAESIFNQAKLDHLAARVGIDIALMRLQKALGQKRPIPL